MRSHVYSAVPYRAPVYISIFMHGAASLTDFPPAQNSNMKNQMNKLQ